MKITENFEREEFACRDGAPYPCKWIDERLHPLCQVLEKIRVKIGRPLKVTSGYRSPAYNEALRKKNKNAAKNSYHMKGMAADFYVTTVKGQKDISAVQLYAIIEDMIKAGEIPDGGLGKYKNERRIVHYDIGPARRWSY